MPNYIKQYLYVAPSFPSVTWRQDRTLERPVLRYPEDGAVVCPETFGKVSGDATGVFLDWATVSEADFYIVQWCNNSSFHGPTLRSVRVAINKYNLSLNKDFRLGESIYWRVMAFSLDGGVSEKSDAWSLKYECSEDEKDQQQSGNRPQSPGGGGGGNGPREFIGKCEQFNVKLVLKGPDRLQCKDKALYHLQINYKCRDEDGQAICSADQTLWSLIVDPADTGTTQFAVTTDTIAVVETDSGASQTITIKAKVIFTDISNATPFECEIEKEVLIDCHAKPPWGCVDFDHYRVADAYNDAAKKPERMKKQSYPIFGSGKMAVGPVFQVSRVKSGTAGGGGDCNRPYAPWNIGLEARVHLPPKWCHYDLMLGPALKAYNTCGIDVDRVAVTYTHIFSIDPGSMTLTVEDRCRVVFAATVQEYVFGVTAAGIVVNPTAGSTTPVSLNVSLYDCYRCCDATTTTTTTEGETTTTTTTEETTTTTTTEEETTTTTTTTPAPCEGCQDASQPPYPCTITIAGCTGAYSSLNGDYEITSCSQSLGGGLQFDIEWNGTSATMKVVYTGTIFTWVWQLNILGKLACNSGIGPMSGSVGSYTSGDVTGLPGSTATWVP